MRSTKTIAWLIFAFASFVQPADAADDLQSVQMVEQARLWQRKNRDDLAADIWRKLLLIDPKHAEALVNLGIIESHAGNLAEAETLYSRAAQLSPRPSGLKDLSAALDAAKGAGSNKLPPQAMPPKQAAPPKQAKQAEPVVNVNPVTPVNQVKAAPSVPVKPAATPVSVKAPTKAVTPAQSTATARKGAASVPTSDDPQLIMSTSLDLSPPKSRP